MARTTEQVLTQILGEKDVRLAVAQSKIEELTEEIERLKAPPQDNAQPR